jgi:hypothetical protein
VIIRSSMLPSYADCARRTVAKQWPKLLAEAGYEVRRLLPSAGAAVGTAAHAAVEGLRRQLWAGQDADLPAAMVPALEKLQTELSPGAEWDTTTPNVAAAEVQVRRLAQAMLPLLREQRPAAVELALAANLKDGWELTGHIDYLGEGGEVDDYKTGAVRRPYQTQLGSYAILAKAHNYHVTTVSITWARRARADRPQPPPEVQRYDVEVATSEAWCTIERIKREMEEFKRSGDAGVLPANPMSMMCSQKYCPAHGTSFCGLASSEQNTHVVD